MEKLVKKWSKMMTSH